MVETSYKKMIHKVAAGDWPAMKKFVELREKYAEERTAVLSGLVTPLIELKRAFVERKEPIPDDLRDLVKQAELSVEMGQFQPG